ncbi:MAG: lytic transglycosylase domain-containing protein [Candidatus Hydrogenedentales bacterium]
MLCVVVMAPFAGTQAFSTSSISGNEERHASRQSELRQRLLQERREAASRRQGMGAFQSKKGVTILTNRPEKYRNRAGYAEITLDYEPIVVPDRFRNRATPGQYSTSEIGELVQRYARQYNVDEGLIYAIIKVESNGNPNAVSPKGARGLMQLMPATAEDMGVKNIHDPAENIAGGTQYIAKLLELFDNNPVNALAGYNAGPENVKKWGGVPPFEETQNYVNKVLRLSARYSKTGVDASYLSNSFLKARMSQEKGAKQVAAVRKEEPKQKFQVRFKSGTIQQAEKVVEEGDYYYMDYKGRSFRVRRGLVETVTPPPMTRQAGSRVASQM